jgi:ketosteroid isomerase-like protein
MACADALAPEVTGQWFGSFDVTHPDGRVENSTIWLTLTQSGHTLTGGIGRDEQTQSPIEAGELTGNDIHFNLNTPGKMSLVFSLHSDGTQLKGEASGELRGEHVRILIIAARANEKSSLPAPVSKTLYDDIARMDEDLFSAFNRRDLPTLSRMFSRDLEFYHDRGGLTHYQDNIEAFRKTFANPTHVRRQLVEGSMEVYPIKGVGAVEIGVHQFYSTVPGGEEQLTATARFVHLWRQDKGSWKIARVISYDHR